MKKLLKSIEAVPSKRIYHSIIADYDCTLALCELIDNAIDNWMHNDMKNPVHVEIDLDYERQVIQVKDNSGGIPESEIELIVSPGQTRNQTQDEVIGFFGVGSKRAVFAMAQEIKIFTRYKAGKTLLIELNDSWISEEGWNIDLYEDGTIDENSTQIELSRLRQAVRVDSHEMLKNHLGATYSHFLEHDGFKLTVNEVPIMPISFESWSYPPEFGPKSWSGNIDFGENGKVRVKILGGLTQSGDPSGDEYGVYFYCNNRLVLRAYKGQEVGFRMPGIGNPHPSKSLTRVIVNLNGPTQLMPWISSKSHINFKHKTFTEIDDHIVRILTHYATLSKNYSSESWKETVFPYSEGEVVEETLDNISSTARIHLPPIPRGPRKKRYPDIIKGINKDLSKQKPWIIGLYEAIIVVEELKRLQLQQCNRISLLIIDSTLEIAFKEFLLNETRGRYSESRIALICRSRVDLQNEVKSNCRIKQESWKQIDYYYIKRCDLVHKRATTQISDEEIELYRKTAEYALSKMFKIKFSD